jgi:hypothetical protein
MEKLLGKRLIKYVLFLRENACKVYLDALCDVLLHVLLLILRSQTQIDRFSSRKVHTRLLKSGTIPASYCS